MGFLSLMKIVAPLAISGAEKLLAGQRGKGRVKKRLAVASAEATLRVLREEGVFDGKDAPASEQGLAQLVDLEIEKKFAAMAELGTVNGRAAGLAPGTAVVIRGTIEGDL